MDTLETSVQWLVRETVNKLPKLSRIYFWYDGPIGWWGEGFFCYLRAESREEKWQEFWIGEVSDEERAQIESGELRVAAAIRAHCDQIAVKNYTTGEVTVRAASESDFAAEYLPDESWSLEYEEGEDDGP